MSGTAEMLDLTTEKPLKKGKSRFYRLVALGILVGIAIFFLGFVIGYFAMKAQVSEPSLTESSGTRKDSRHVYKQYHEQMVDSLNADSVKKFS